MVILIFDPNIIWIIAQPLFLCQRKDWWSGAAENEESSNVDNVDNVDNVEKQKCKWLLETWKTTILGEEHRIYVKKIVELC